jgi:MATE family multidrug resistance protein
VSTPTHRPGSLKELLAVSLPLVLSAGSLSLMNIVDRIFLTWHSTAALAAATPAAVLHWTVISLALGTAIYVNTFVAQYEGAGRPDRVAASIWQGLYLSFGAGVILLGVIPFTPWIFAVVDHAPAVRELEIEYFSILCTGGIPFMLTAVMACFYSGRGKSMVVMWINIAAVAVNALLDWFLIFGHGLFPEMGIGGAALATVISKSLAVVAYAVLMLTSVDGKKYGLWENRGYDRALFARLIRYGLPNGLQFFADIAGFALFIFLLGRLGEEALAATNMAFTINQLAFVPMLGFGTAVMTLVGKRIGEGRPGLAVRTTWTAFAFSSAYMIACALLFVVFPDVVIAPFVAVGETSGNTALVEQVTVLLRFVAVFVIFDAMAIVFGSAVRGAGDTRFSLVLVVLSAWLVMVLPVVLMAVFAEGSLMVGWTACTLYIVVVGIGFVWRFLAGHWQHMRVIESSEELAQADETLPVVAGPSAPALQPTAEPDVWNPACLSQGNLRQYPHLYRR